MGETRWANTADVPTFREQGFDVVDGSLRGLGRLGRHPWPRAATPGRRGKGRDAAPRLHGGGDAAAIAAALDPDQHRAVLFAMRENYQRMWTAHPWRD